LTRIDERRLLFTRVAERNGLFFRRRYLGEVCHRYRPGFHGCGLRSGQLATQEGLKKLLKWIEQQGEVLVAIEGFQRSEPAHREGLPRQRPCLPFLQAKRFSRDSQMKTRIIRIGQ
jgi:hypothetical protein